MMPFLKGKQESARKFASTFAPSTAIGLTLRDLGLRLLRFLAIADYLAGRGLRDGIDLPDYGLR
jgi:hypothetical protein